MEAEISQIAAHNLWDQVYAQVKRDSMNNDYTNIEASKPENRSLNRYRDVYPYDHSRVVLQDCVDTDYINASLVQVSRASRKYILAQGPLPSTVGHFWLTVWQRNSKAILMLNRVIERGQQKCHQYWPLHEGQTMDFPNVNLSLEHVESEPGQHYTVRTLKLTNTETDESRDILHFHYTTWPDFGVPQCPDSFLEYLHAVRDSGSLDGDVGPAIVHCSAGIGRSGTFCLVDTCLVLIDKEGPESVCVKEILLELRNYRMGLIQTPDQLKFSYLAIVEGAKGLGLISREILSELVRPPTRPLLPSDSSSSSDDDLDDEDVDLDDSEEDDNAPPLPPRRSESLIKSNLHNNGLDNFSNTIPTFLKEQVNGNNHDSSTTSSSEPTPPDNLAPPTHQRLTASASAPLQDSNLSGGHSLKTDLYTTKSNLQGSSSNTASPTKCILNNHKMEERRREMEIRRRKKDEKNKALEQQIQEMKRKAKESEEWQSKKNFFIEKMVPFCVGLAMLIAGTVYYMRS